MARFKIIIAVFVCCCNFCATITSSKPQEPNYELIKSGMAKVIRSVFGVQSPIPDDIKENIRFRVDHGYNVGIVVGVVSPEATDYYSYGKTSAAGEQQVDENTIFEIGSITKVFTALLLAEMVEQRELSFNDTIEKYLPKSVNVPKRKNQSITLLHLAMFSSGLPYMPDNMDLTTNPDNPLASYTVEQMYDFLSKYKLRYDIGTRCEYSNCNHALLGHILSLKTGKRYEDLVKERITARLGMKDTAIILTEEMQKRLAKGYGGVIEAPPMGLEESVFVGSGGLYSSAQDMVRFLEACIGLKQTRLKPGFERIYALVKEPPGTYEKPVGSVWMQEQTIRWFEGRTLGQNSFIGFIKEEQKGVVVLSNTNHDVKDIGFHLLNPNSPLSTLPVPAKVPANTLGGYVGKYQLGSEEISVLFRNGHLILDKKWDMVPIKCTLYAKSESEYWNPALNIKITFQTNPNGEVNSLVLYQHGSSKGQQAKKIDGNEAGDDANRPASERLFEVSKIKEDLGFVFKNIEEVHPNMYAYISKEEFAKYRNQLYKQIDHSMNRLEFYKLVARAVTHLRTGHCKVFSYGVNEFSTEGKLFPLECQWDPPSLIVTIDHTGGNVPVGSKILAINGQEASELIDRLAKYCPSDQKVGNPYKAAAAISYFLWVENGQVDTYKVTVKPHDEPIEDLELRTVTIDQIKSKKGKNAEKSKKNFSYRFLEQDNASILEVYTFDAKLMEEFTEFLNSSFKEIRRDKVPNIVIDIRKNKGGTTNMSSLLLGYLTDQPFRQFDRYELKISKQLLDPTNNAHRRISKRAAENAKIGSILVKEVPFEEPAANPWRFNGRAFVLIGRRTFSSACSFASAIKCFQIGTLVGEEPQETTGKYSDILVFNLPNSGLQFSVPCKYYVVACGQDDGRGVIPDYEVKQRPEDTAKGVDTVLQFTLRLISESHTKINPKQDF